MCSDPQLKKLMWIIMCYSYVAAVWNVCQTKHTRAREPQTQNNYERIKFKILTQTAVSYTHLDVYKRQWVLVPNKLERNCNIILLLIVTTVFMLLFMHAGACVFVSCF